MTSCCFFIFVVFPVGLISYTIILISKNNEFTNTKFHKFLITFFFGSPASSILTIEYIYFCQNMMAVYACWICVDFFFAVIEAKNASLQVKLEEYHLKIEKSQLIEQSRKEKLLISVKSKLKNLDNSNQAKNVCDPFYYFLIIVVVYSFCKFCSK